MYTSLQAFKRPSGVLVPIEFDVLPFVPKRMFYTCCVPKDEELGNHAHYQTKHDRHYHFCF